MSWTFLQNWKIYCCCQDMKRWSWDLHTCLSSKIRSFSSFWANNQPKNNLQHTKNPKFQNLLSEAIDVNNIFPQKLIFGVLTTQWSKKHVTRWLWDIIFGNSSMQTPDNMCLGPNFNASRLGNRLRFFSSVKSSWAPIIQISTYTEIKENEKL